MYLSTRLLLLVACIFTLPVQADSLYRCVARSGAVSYQSQTCAVQQRLDRVMEYQPEPLMVRVDPASSMSHRKSRAAMKHGGTRRVHSHGVITANQRCRTGKAHREASLQRLGLKRTYAQLSALDAGVRANCNGY